VLVQFENGNSFSLPNFASGFAVFAVFLRLTAKAAKIFAKNAKQTTLSLKERG
jgi:hypothetical protein